ncbi:SPOR domain-containing protein [Steroidobacter sp.]|uniref:SPOR domain-containing protein n=1 Tax=Steroidobacter sp. TaxID=1978227 RepID=UPI001A3E3247|nr:SPOR domain-containing protein [Steroidobacter sp.]MBL8267380.1 SPOR domain-containing protein [Steroidobacter sp.]
MERPVKERLIGAAVLMAAAVILIPEMLSGPDRDPVDQPAKTAANGEGAGEASIKTYTIDLSQSPGAQPATPVEQTETRAPPPEEAPPPETSAPVEQTPPAAAPAPVQASPEPQPVVTAEPAPRQLAAQPARAEAPPQAPPKAEPKPKPEPKPEPKVEPRPVASPPPAPKSTAPTAVPTGKGWAVQLGSYASESTAQRIANEWRAKGQSAFVMPVTTGGKTLYRVRIGPSKDRAGADAALKAVKPSIPSAAVVAHP